MGHGACIKEIVPLTPQVTRGWVEGEFNNRDQPGVEVANTLVCLCSKVDKTCARISDTRWRRRDRKQHEHLYKRFGSNSVVMNSLPV